MLEHACLDEELKLNHVGVQSVHEILVLRAEQKLLTKHLVEAVPCYLGDFTQVASFAEVLTFKERFEVNFRN